LAYHTDTPWIHENLGILEGVVDELLCFNGIDGTTGDYALPPMTGSALASLVLGEAPPEDELALRTRKQRDDAGPEAIARLEQELAVAVARLAEVMAAGSPDRALVRARQREVDRLKTELARRRHLGVKEGVDPLDLAQAGWGVILPAGGDPAIREALQDLLELRAAQAGPRFRVFEGPAGHRPGESKSAFLVRQGTDPSGPANPERVPYYLLIVGDPQRIPYVFQYQLDVQYAVGRIWFPRVEQYAQYAQSVVEAETGGIRRPRRVTCFGAQSPDDDATERSTRLLVGPLHEHLSSHAGGWSTQLVSGAEASRARLESLLGGSETPALLFAASHGLELPAEHPRQAAHQGALLCSDWPGPVQWKGRGEIPQEHYLAGDHLAAAADVAGMMVFGFACYGAGTPLHDEFGRLRQLAEPRRLAREPFVSALPCALLGRPGGALAFVGHVERAWACSYGDVARSRSYLGTFQSTLARLLDGQPVGHALDYVNARHAELSTELADELQDEFKQHDPHVLAWLWTTRNDARGYVVLGDPAARLSFEGGAVRPVGAARVGAEPAVVVAQAPVAGPALASEPEIARPAEIDEVDWARTPEAVRRYIAALRSR
jgi:hypothetical protein